MISLPKDKKLVDLGFGIEKEDSIILSELELYYAIEKGYIPGEKPKIDNNKYLVFKDLREKSYIVSFSEANDYFRVYRKGFRRGEDRTLYLLRVLDSDKINLEELGNDLAEAGKMRKDLVYALVENNKVFYLSISRKQFP
jgi:tRNA splicing endonuclease